MRDYVVFWCALETNVANLSDFPQFILCLNEDDAKLNAQGMTPMFGGEIVTAKIAVAFHKRTELYSVCFAYVQSAIKDPNNPFHSPNISFDFSESGASSFRAAGINSKTEKPGFKASQTGNVILPDAIAQEIVFLQAFAEKLLKSRSLNDQRNGSIILAELKKSFLGTQTFTQALINIQPILDQYR